MKLTGVAALLLAASPMLVAGCASDDTCEDLDSLQAQLDDTEPDDPDYNDLVERLKLAEADCNAR